VAASGPVIAGVTYYHRDHLGSALVVSDSAGQVLQQVAYAAFGDSQGPPAPEFGFTGQRLVTNGGLYDYGFRWYDPTLGRFLQPDPILSDPFEPQMVNPYSYVRNDPVGLVDPLGLQPFPCDSCIDFVPPSPSRLRWEFSDPPSVGLALSPSFQGPGLSHSIPQLPAPVSTPMPATSVSQGQQGREYPADFIGPLGPNDTLSPIPTAPPGVDINANIEEAARQRDVRWFYNQVRNKGPWDYKQQGPEYQNFGNFNYGATGRALGLSEGLLLREAGRAQQAAGTSRPGDPGSRLNPWGGTG
jgi:RHS repeat-associated protein